MTRNDVIRMAREAGLLIPSFHIGGGLALGSCTVSDFERFAALVAAAEREEFLKWCEVNIEGVTPKTDWTKGYVMALKNVAEGFRARSN